MSEIELISYVKRGKNRNIILKNINTIIMPSELSIKIYGNSDNTNLTVVSRALAEFLNKKLVKVLNPKEKTGRLYELTPLGKKIQDKL